MSRHPHWDNAIDGVKQRKDCGNANFRKTLDWLRGIGGAETNALQTNIVDVIMRHGGGEKVNTNTFRNTLLYHKTIYQIYVPRVWDIRINIGSKT